MGWLLRAWQMFSDAHLCLCTLSECVCLCTVGACICVCVSVCVLCVLVDGWGLCFSSHLDTLNGSVDINLFSWTAIVRHWDGELALYHPSWESMETMCITVSVVCCLPLIVPVYVCRCRATHACII